MGGLGGRLVRGTFPSIMTLFYRSGAVILSERAGRARAKDLRERARGTRASEGSYRGAFPTRPFEVEWSVMATNPREALIRVVSAARDQAKTILATLEQHGHPQTSESNGVYFGLVTILKQLRTIDPAPPVAGLASELEQLAGLCVGKLAPLEAQLREAARVARGAS